jgi:predicted  nucleic acid-binding Zn-ribbon protein
MVPVPPKADPFVQRRLLDVARLDQVRSAAEHRRRTLPELAQIATGSARVDELRNAGLLAQAEIGDLDRAAKKLDNEIDAVRARAKRDADRLASGTAPAKDLENIQHGWCHWPAGRRRWRTRRWS